MFRRWTAGRSALMFALERARCAFVSRHYFVIALVAAVLMSTFTSTASADQESSQPNIARPTSLKLGIHYNDPALVERLREHTRKALALASHFNDFECRLSADVLNCARGARIVMEGPFQDVLVKIPVSGDARLEGTFCVLTVPDSERACIDIHIDGTVNMRGIGQTQGVRIESDATAEFKAVKRLYVSHDGARALPATCTADSSLVFTGIHSRPRLLGKFAERIAQQRAHEEKDQAEAECTQHTIGAIAAVLDREGDRMAQAIDQAIQEHLAAANEAQRATWHQTKFCSGADFISITRTGTGTTPLAPWQPVAGKPAPSIMLRLPRTAFRPDQLLLALGLIGGSPANADAPRLSSDESMPALRPSILWQDQTVTLAVDLKSVARVAQEPVLGAAQ